MTDLATLMKTLDRRGSLFSLPRNQPTLTPVTYTMVATTSSPIPQLIPYFALSRLSETSRNLARPFTGGSQPPIPLRDTLGRNSAVPGRRNWRRETNQREILPFPLPPTPPHTQRHSTHNPSVTRCSDGEKKKKLGSPSPLTSCAGVVLKCCVNLASLGGADRPKHQTASEVIIKKYSVAFLSMKVSLRTVPQWRQINGPCYQSIQLTPSSLPLASILKGNQS